MNDGTDVEEIMYEDKAFKSLLDAEDELYDVSEQSEFEAAMQHHINIAVEHIRTAQRLRKAELSLEIQER